MRVCLLTPLYLASEGARHECRKRKRGTPQLATVPSAAKADAPQGPSAVALPSKARALTILCLENLKTAAGNSLC